jgi:hypothetical protein
MINIRGEIAGDELVIRIDVSQKARTAAQPSKSAKTKVLASTNGFVKFGDVSLNLNATLKPEGSGGLE